MKKSKNNLKALIKVYKNGRTEMLEGKSLKEYLEILEGAFFIQWLYGLQPERKKKIKWKKVKIRIEK